jgi:hypothetical protein
MRNPRNCVKHLFFVRLTGVAQGTPITTAAFHCRFGPCNLMTAQPTTALPSTRKWSSPGAPYAPSIAKAQGAVGGIVSDALRRFSNNSLHKIQLFLSNVADSDAPSLLYTAGPDHTATFAQPLELALKKETAAGNEVRSLCLRQNYGSFGIKKKINYENDRSNALAVRDMRVCKCCLILWIRVGRIPPARSFVAEGVDE